MRLASLLMPASKTRGPMPEVPPVRRVLRAGRPGRPNSRIEEEAGDRSVRIEDLNQAEELEVGDVARPAGAVQGRDREGGVEAAEPA